MKTINNIILFDKSTDKFFDQNPNLTSTKNNSDNFFRVIGVDSKKWVTIIT